MRIILLFFIFISCQKKSFEKAGELWAKERWPWARSISNQNELLSGSALHKAPMDVWQHLFSVNVRIDDENTEDCVFFKRDSEKTGEIKIKTKARLKTCEDEILEPGDAVLKNISAYQWDGIKLVFIQNNEEVIFNFINSKKEVSSYQLLDAPGTDFAISGIKLKNEPEIKLNDGEICFDVDDDCNVLIDNNCDACVGASYPVVSSKCKNGYRMVCGENHCGELNQTACPRGFQSISYEEDYCINGSPVGICGPGFNVYCENGVLMCK